MTFLIVSIAVVLGVSALCSLTEAALYAVRVSYVRQLADSGSRSGRILTGFKANMERPIAAILVVNTAANTAGATIAGAQAELVLGHSALIWFSVAFTTAVLVFSEILPKILGVAYSQSVARFIAVGLHVATTALQPIVWIVQCFSQLILPKGHIAVAPEDEVRHMAWISAEEGSILPIEAELVQNVLKLDEIRAAQIMTPRTVVTDLPAGMTVAQADERHPAWTQARMPVRSDEDPETWIGVVLRRDILTALARDEHDTTIGTLCQPLHFVPFSTPGHVLLRQFLKRRTHLFGVVDERGSVMGVVSLEDVLESLVGEIVDEVDEVVDMQQFARDRSQRPTWPGPKGIADDQGDPSSS